MSGVIGGLPASRQRMTSYTRPVTNGNSNAENWMVQIYLL